MSNKAKVAQKSRFLVSCALLLTLSGVLPACSNQKDAQALISEAKDYEKKGETKAAIIQLKNALRESPENVEARSLLGIYYIKTGDTLSAESEIRKALSLGGKPADLLPLLGQVLLLQGEFQKVLDQVNLPAEPKATAQYFAVRGQAYAALGNTSEARRAFTSALENSQNYPDALLGMAKLALVENDSVSAQKFVDQAISSNPNDSRLVIFKGDVLLLVGERDDALVAYTKAIALNPSNVSAYIAKANLLTSTGKFDAAKKELDSARKQDPKALSISYSEAVLEFRQGKLPSALASVQQILKTAPEHMPSILLAGAIQSALGSTQQAEQHFKKYVERNPGNAYATRLLITTLLKNGDSQQALKRLTPLLDAGTDDPQVLALAGEAYMQTRDFSKASEFFEKASAVAPNVAALKMSLGMSRLAQGDDARGIAELEQAADLDPKSMSASVVLIKAHMQRSEFDQALVAANKLEKLHPQNPLLLNLKGGVLLAKKDSEGARTSFHKAVTLDPHYFPAMANLAKMDLFEMKADAAKKRLQAFSESNKENTEAMLMLSDLALAQGNNDEALDWLEQANRKKPDELKPALALTTTYLKMGQISKAFDLAQKMQVAHPDNLEVLDLLGKTQLASKNLETALQTYKRLATLAPKSTLAQLRLASVYVALGDADRATTALNSALSINPNDLAAQLALATLAVRRKDFDTALSIAAQIQSKGDKKATGFLLQGDVLTAQQKPDLALVAYKQAFALDKNSMTVIKLHEAMARAGKEKEGQENLIRWVTQNPKDFVVSSYLGMIYLRDRRAQPAIKQFEAVLLAQPKNPVALNNLAIAYQMQNDPRATEFAERAYGVAPDNGAILDTLGWLLLGRGDTKRAVTLLEQASRLLPEQVEVRFHYAQALLKAGDKATARKELEIVAADKNYTKAGDAYILLQQTR